MKGKDHQPMDPRHIHISDYTYELPPERIARFPEPERDSSRLLIYNEGAIGEDTFSRLPEHLPQGALMVFNNTRVIQARLHFRKPTGALIEVFLLEPLLPNDYEQMFQSTGSCSWLCLVGNQKKWKDGPLQLTFASKGQQLTLRATRSGESGASQRIDFEWDNPQVSFAEIVDAIGELPIPPYLNRATEESDLRTYQTVYSKIKGSVAAPTAGLHFTERVLRELDQRGIEREELTLHVGAGTFKPVKSQEMLGHEMHTEHICVSRTTIERLIAHQAKAIAVGTTSVRTLESLYYMGLRAMENPDISEEQLHIGQWEPYSKEATAAPAEALSALLRYMDGHKLATLRASTQIMIAPGYEYKIVNTLITNFHQPQSTLLLLVGAFVGDDWRKIYNYALAGGFRFLSYGDSSLLIPKRKI